MMTDVDRHMRIVAPLVESRFSELRANDAIRHYEDIAPDVARWARDLRDRLTTRDGVVTTNELRALAQLRDLRGWLDADDARETLAIVHEQHTHGLMAAIAATLAFQQPAWGVA